MIRACDECHEHSPDYWIPYGNQSVVLCSQCADRILDDKGVSLFWDYISDIESSYLSDLGDTCLSTGWGKISLTQRLKWKKANWEQRHQDFLKIKVKVNDNSKKDQVAERSKEDLTTLLTRGDRLIKIIRTKYGIK